MAPPISIHKLWRRRAKSTSVQWRIAIRSKTDDIRNGVIVALASMLLWHCLASGIRSNHRVESVLPREPAQAVIDRGWNGYSRFERQEGVLAHPSLGGHPSSDVI